MKMIRIAACCIFGCLMFSATWSWAEPDAPPVVDLKKLYSTNPEFKKTMDKALANIKSPYNGAQNPWKGRTFKDFCSFFNDWYALLPVNGKNPPPSLFPPGQKVDEFNFITIFGGFYYDNEYGQQIVGKEPGLGWTQDFVVSRGKFMDSTLSTCTISQWMADPTIHIDDYIIPPSGFRSFNEFFTRKLKPGKRTVASPTDDSVLVAPTDCVLNMIQPLTPDTRVSTKLNQKLNIRELLNGSNYAEKFENGTAISCILLPNTYHNYHFVASGTVVESHDDVAGQYSGIPNFPAFVNKGNIGYGQSYSVFEHFRRGYVVMKTKEYGYIAMIPVGLDTIGSVMFEDAFRNVAAPRVVPINKGDMLGHFAYGGSMVITLIEQGIESITIPQGQQIGIFKSKATEQ
jgi:phosphatidylserine decarboxylase